MKKILLGIFLITSTASFAKTKVEDLVRSCLKSNGPSLISIEDTMFLEGDYTIRLGCYGLPAKNLFKELTKKKYNLLQDNQPGREGDHVILRTLYIGDRSSRIGIGEVDEVSTCLKTTTLDEELFKDLGEKVIKNESYSCTIKIDLDSEVIKRVYQTVRPTL